MENNSLNKEQILLNRKLKNIQGLHQLEKIKLEYTKEIILILKDNINILPDLLQELQITEDEFFTILSGKENKENITFYDQTLISTKQLIKEKIKNKEKF